MGQVVRRLLAITPNTGGHTATVTYDAGGLSVTPASGQTLSTTTDWNTTGSVDYTITKPAAGGTPRRVTFTVSALGFADGTDSIDVEPDEINPPDLDVVPTPGTTSYTITYTVSATTFEYSTDGAAYASVPASPFTVSRNAPAGATKELTFRAIRDGVTVTAPVTIPPQELGIISLSISSNPTFTDSTNELAVTWTTSGMPTGVKYNVSYVQGGSDGAEGFANDVSSVYTFSGVSGTTASGSVRVDAEYLGTVIATRTRAGTWTT